MSYFYHGILLSTRHKRCSFLERARMTNHTVDEAWCASLKICRSVSGDPCCGSELGDALDGGVGEAGKDVGEVVAHRNLEPSTAFDNREDRRHARSSLFAADVVPVLSARCNWTHRVLSQVIAQFQFQMFQEDVQPLP